MIDLVLKWHRLLSPRERAQALMLLAAMLVAALFEMAGVGAIPVFIGALANPGALQSYAPLRRMIGEHQAASSRELVMYAAGALFVLFVVKNIYLALLSWAQARYVYNRQVNIAQRLYAAYLYSPYSFHLHRNTAELLRNTNQDAWQVVAMTLLPLLQITGELLTGTAILVLLLTAEPLASLVGFVILGGTTFIFLRLVRGRMLRIGLEERRFRAEMIQIVNEGLGGIKVTKALGRERYFVDAFNASSNGYAVLGRVRQILSDAPRLTLETVAVGALVGVAALLISRGRTAAELLTTLTLFAVAVIRMIPSFTRSSLWLNNVRLGKATVDGLYHDLTALEQEAPGRGQPMSFRSRITLDNVSFTYPGASTPSLRGIDLEITAGEAVAFIGPTGSGKTTLVDLILGLLSPSEGRILVDGQDIRGREDSWQRVIGYIPQDVYLADTTIRENIAFGIPAHAIDDAAVWRAVDAANVREFLERLPHGLETVAGERGVRLSGGQRQRIGIARALYHDPAILVMDEATSALDTDTEQYVMQAIDQLRGSKTLILIAHRHSTIRMCDRIYELRDGRLGEERGHARAIEVPL